MAGARTMTMTDQPTLRMEHISKSFSGTRVLHDVTFTLQAGEVHILAGENGAGKSTLMKVLGGVHREYEGTIFLEGKPLRLRSPLHAASSGIAIIHQELSLIPSMSVSDNMWLGREHAGHGGWMHFGSQQAACHAFLERLGLDIDVRRNVEDYPISVQQIIEIAKALAINARIIVMDEPTSALTAPEVEKLFSLIDELKAQGHAIVYISHKMEEIYRVGDRITVLRDGEYIGTAPADELPRDEFVRWMVGREVSEQFPRHQPHLGDERLTLQDFSVADPVRPGKKAVRNVSLSVRAGEIVGLAGLQGSGASELLNGLFGTYGRRATVGHVTLKGQAFTPSSPGHSIGSGLALLTNDRKATGLVLGMSVARNITLASLKRHSPGWWIRHGLEDTAAEAHREALSIKTPSTRYAVSSLSGGNQQKVALAKWLETRPDVLLLDEPTRGVDVGAKHEIYELMNQWTAEGIAILLITSEMPELLALSDRVLVMHRGEISAEYAHDEATQEAILNAAMTLSNHGDLD